MCPAVLGFLSFFKKSLSFARISSEVESTVTSDPVSEEEIRVKPEERQQDAAEASPRTLQGPI